MEIMEVNEELAEAEDKETVQAIGQRNQEILKRLLRYVMWAIIRW